MSHKSGAVIAGKHEDAARSEDNIARISHDIHSRINIITGFSELLLDEVPGKINDEQRRCLNDILESGRRLLSQLNAYFE